MLGILGCKGHEHIFFVWLPFGEWYQMVQGHEMEVGSEEPVNSEDIVVGEPKFEEETSPLQ